MAQDSNYEMITIAVEPNDQESQSGKLQEVIKEIGLMRISHIKIQPSMKKIKCCRTRSEDVGIFVDGGTDYEEITEIEGLAVERYLGTSPQVTPSPVAVETGTRNVK